MTDERHDIYERLCRETIPSVVSVYVAADADRRRGSGSGFVYDEAHVVTNHHVVRGAEEVDLRFSEGDWRTGRVVGTDAYTDLAVVAVEPPSGAPTLPAYARPLPVAASNPTPGRRVAALGNPMELDGSITTGIVSGANRSMPTREGFAIPDTVQTDAAINPGNSGGPLVTFGDGEEGDEPAATPSDATDPSAIVVGVNRARGGDNIGFAVSPAVVNRVVPALIADGEYRHSYLKVATLDVSPTVAEANGLPEPGGVLVVDVRLGPASGALVGCGASRRIRGQEVPVGGDVIVGVDGRSVDSHEELMRHLLLETTPGEAVSVDLLRDGEQLTEHLTLGERPEPRAGGRVVVG